MRHRNNFTREDDNLRSIEHALVFFISFDKKNKEKYSYKSTGRKECADIFKEPKRKR